MQLNLFIAKSGYCSRRKAAILIKEGHVTVNGRKVIEPWIDIRDRDLVKVAGRKIDTARHAYLILNKPKGVTSTLDDRFASKIISELVPAKFGKVYPVGRLDRDSRGLIVLTNDGELCYSLTHPKFEVEKEYVITIKGGVKGSIVRNLEKGALDEGDLLKVKKANVIKTSNDRSIVKVVVCEGRKRHLRRLLWRLGYEIIDLVRIRIGGLKLGDLRTGKFRVLDMSDIAKLKKGGSL